MDEVELMQNTEYVNVKWQCTPSNDTILRTTHFIDWIHAEELWRGKLLITIGNLGRIGKNKRVVSEIITLKLHWLVTL